MGIGYTKHHPELADEANAPYIAFLLHWQETTQTMLSGIAMGDVHSMSWMKGTLGGANPDPSNTIWGFQSVDWFITMLSILCCHPPKTSH